MFVGFEGCKTQEVNAVQIVFFDRDDFGRTDTLLITNADTVNSINKLIGNMVRSGVKFPRNYEIKMIGNKFSEIYFTDGKGVSKDRTVYEFREGKELIILQSILNSKKRSE